jgi:hypothetical protein
MRLDDLVREILARPDDTDTIDRHAAARMLGVTVRTLQRWHRAGYGPPRKAWRGRGVGYSRAQVQRWLAEPPQRRLSPMSALCMQLQSSGHCDPQASAFWEPHYSALTARSRIAPPPVGRFAGQFCGRPHRRSGPIAARRDRHSPASCDVRCGLSQSPGVSTRSHEGRGFVLHGRTTPAPWPRTSNRMHGLPTASAAHRSVADSPGSVTLMDAADVQTHHVVECLCSTQDQTHGRSWAASSTTPGDLATGAESRRI